MLDAIGAVVGVASIIIGSYASLFLIGAVHRGDTRAAAECGVFFIGIALANGIVDALRYWRRHYRGPSPGRQSATKASRRSPATRVGPSASIAVIRPS